MSDVHTKEQRSRNMAAIRSRGNKSTEIAVLRLLRKAGIAGWRRHSRFLRGTPDFIFPEQKAAIFIDGCFWHGCMKCKLNPKTNKNFWTRKIATNRRRDRKIDKTLRIKGWRVLRIWEHEVRKDPTRIIHKIKKYITLKTSHKRI